MTAEEVQDALGLISWDRFRDRPERQKWLEEARKTKTKEWVDHYTKRMTGRTERMLCSILAALANGYSVRIFSGSYIQSKVIAQRLKDRAKKIGISWRNKIKITGAADLEFFDHTYYER